MERKAPLVALYAALSACEEVLPVKLYRPVSLQQQSSLRTAVIGIEGLDFQDEAAIAYLLLQLADLGDATPNYVLLLPVRQQRASTGLRYTKVFLNWLKAMVNGEDVPQPADWELPLPKAPAAEDLEVLAGIANEVIAEPHKNDWVLQVLQALWKLMAYRQRLADSSVLTTTWLPQIIKATQTFVNRELSRLQPVLEVEKLNQLTTCAAQCFADDAEVDESYLVELLAQLQQTPL
jgi:hypothetical protein